MLEFEIHDNDKLMIGWDEKHRNVIHVVKRWFVVSWSIWFIAVFWQNGIMHMVQHQSMYMYMDLDNVKSKTIFNAVIFSSNMMMLKHNRFV